MQVSHRYRYHFVTNNGGVHRSRNRDLADMSQPPDTLTNVKTLTRAVAYPLIILAAAYYFVLPHGTQYAGYYPTAPKPVNITGPHPHGTYYIPAVADQPKPPGAETIHALLWRGTWTPGVDEHPGTITNQDARNITTQWRNTTTYVRGVTGSSAPLTLHHSDRASGTSYGLAATLAALDSLTPGTLTSTPIAATGTVTANGKVGPIGGLDAKIVGINNTDATVFFVPDSNTWTVPATVPVVPVHTVTDAITYLCTLGSNDTLCNP